VHIFAHEGYEVIATVYRREGSEGIAARMTAAEELYEAAVRVLDGATAEDFQALADAVEKARTPPQQPQRRNTT
jgi:NAD(P)-dependent dehydrogenase (short-subunit alcohol dehydrogenase family)